MDDFINKPRREQKPTHNPLPGTPEKLGPSTASKQIPSSANRGHTKIPTPQYTPRSPRQRKQFKAKNRKWPKIAAIAVLILMIPVGFYGYKLISAGNQVFGGNVIQALIKNDDLIKDKYGRTNILIFGTSEDDAGHSGALLADSIMVLSVDQETKAANTISIPRDLWVKYGGACNTQEGKINAVYSCGISAGKSQEESSMKFADVASTFIGTDVHYYVKVNYSFVKDAVNALGGINVAINSTDPRGIHDIGTNLKISNGSHNIDGEQALKLARARNARGGYGLPRSNFDREKNQQLILRALQDKALSSGTFANPVAVSKLADSLGRNVSTNIPSANTRKLLNIAQELPGSNIESIDLMASESPQLKTAPISGQSTVIPTMGTFDYSTLHETIAKRLVKPNLSM